MIFLEHDTGFVHKFFERIGIGPSISDKVISQLYTDPTNYEEYALKAKCHESMLSVFIATAQLHGFEKAQTWFNIHKQEIGKRQKFVRHDEKKRRASVEYVQLKNKVWMLPEMEGPCSKEVMTDKTRKLFWPEWTDEEFAIYLDYCLDDLLKELQIYCLEGELFKRVNRSWC